MCRIQKWKIGLLSVLLVGLVGAFVQPKAIAVLKSKSEMELALQQILQNLAHPQIRRGAVIASPSQRDPDYFYHWTRDAGLTMGVLHDMRARWPQLAQLFPAWAEFERLAVSQSTQAGGGGLGEPKYHVDGRAFVGPWGRPQNDGPAIRSWAFMRAFGRLDGMVEADLEYLRLNWGEVNFDLWEEVKGHHFFTRYSQMAAFLKAAEVSQAGRQSLRVRQNLEMAWLIETTLSHFVDRGRQIVVPTVGRVEGPDKPAGLDVSVILAPLYFGEFGSWSIANSYILATALRIEETFRILYPINSNYPDMAPGIGRYPEDVYDGNGFSGGHPWFLATFAMGEMYCRLAGKYAQEGRLRLDPVNVTFFKAQNPRLFGRPGVLEARHAEFGQTLANLQAKGESFLRRSMFHAGADRRYAEQFDRSTGFRRGARDLTWSYAAALRAFDACEKSAKILATTQGARR